MTTASDLTPAGRRVIRALKRAAATGGDCYTTTWTNTDPDTFGMYAIAGVTAAALERRGLVTYRLSPAGVRLVQLTDAGRVVAEGVRA